MKQVILSVLRCRLVPWLAALLSRCLGPRLAALLGALLGALAVALGSGCKMQMTDFSCEISSPAATSASST